MSTIHPKSSGVLNAEPDHWSGDDAMTFPQLGSLEVASTSRVCEEINPNFTMHADEIWHRPPTSDPAISELMTEGCKLLMAPSRAPKVIPQGNRQLLEAEKIFSQIIHLDPAFAEVGVLPKQSLMLLANGLRACCILIPALADAQPLFGSQDFVHVI